VGGPKSRSGRGGEEKNSQHAAIYHSLQQFGGHVCVKRHVSGAKAGFQSVNIRRSRVQRKSNCRTAHSQMLDFSEHLVDCISIDSDQNIVKHRIKN